MISEAQHAAQAIASEQKGGSNQYPDLLPWLAGVAGVATFGAALIVTNVTITATGIYLSCQTAGCCVTAVPFSVSFGIVSHGRHFGCWGCCGGSRVLHPMEKASGIDEKSLGALC
jgi:hypothetical protein